MSNVTESPEQSNAPKTTRPTWEEMVTNPLLALTTFQTGVVGDPTWAYQVWYDRTNGKLEKLKKSIRPDKPASIEKEVEIIYLTGILELLEWLSERESVIKKGTPGFMETLAGYKKGMQLYEQHIEQLQETIQVVGKQADQSIDLAQSCMKVCQDWKELAYENLPIPGEFLSRANLAMRLQRPHKSN